MAKLKTAYVCQNCGAAASKWSGQCSDCGSWNTLVESVITAAQSAHAARPGSVPAHRPCAA